MKHDHCKHCGACEKCDRCDHCGFCRKCGRWVAAPVQYVPYPYYVYPIQQPAGYWTSPTVIATQISGYVGEANSGWTITNTNIS